MKPHPILPTPTRFDPKRSIQTLAGLLAIAVVGLLVPPAAAHAPARLAGHPPTHPNPAAPLATATPTDAPDPRRSILIRGRLTEGPGPGALPIIGKRVIVWASPGRCDWSTTTDPDGRFVRRCDDVTDSGQLQVHVLWHLPTDPWVRTYRVKDLVNSEGTADIAVIVVYPTPGGASPTPTADDDLRYVSMTGLVVDGSLAGKPPIVGARVALGGSLRGGFARCLSPIFTDQAGKFEAWCPSANYIADVEISVQAAGYATWSGGIRGQWFYGQRVIELMPDGTSTPSPGAGTINPGPPTNTPPAGEGTPTPSPWIPPPSATPTPPIAGDIGWRTVRGTVFDGRTDPRRPLAGAKVTCSQFSYNPRPGSCAPGEVVTGPSGSFSFDVFVHDTDRITIAARLPGYRAAEQRFQGFACVGACPTVDLLLGWEGWKAYMPWMARTALAISP